MCVCKYVCVYVCTYVYSTHEARAHSQNTSGAGAKCIHKLRHFGANKKTIKSDWPGSVRSTNNRFQN